MQTGEHLVSGRVGYTHHGLYIGGGKVIHYAGLSDLRDWANAEVEQVPLAEFEAGSTYTVEAHPNRRYTAAESVQRAQSRLGENLYNLAVNNCEHFVNYCIEGEHRSKQVEVVTGAMQGAAQALESGTGREALEEGRKLAKKGAEALI